MNEQARNARRLVQGQQEQAQANDASRKHGTALAEAYSKATRNVMKKAQVDKAESVWHYVGNPLYTFGEATTEHEYKAAKVSSEIAIVAYDRAAGLQKKYPTLSDENRDAWISNIRDRVAAQIGREREEELWKLYDD